MSTTYNKITIDGTTYMDLSQDTVASTDHIRSGYVGHLNDGTQVTGTYSGGGTPRTSSDLTVSGATVTAPAGTYASDASISVASGTAGTPTASKGTVSNHSISVTPSVTNTTGYITGGTKTGTAVTVSASELVSGTKAISGSGTTDVTEYASASVAAGSATTPATTVTANPSISVNSSTGLITATASATKSVTPTVSAGYVSSGTAGTITVSGSNTSQLTTQAAQTIHPSTSDQTITSGKYLTGAQTVKAVTTTNLTAANIKSGVTIEIGDSTDSDCVASVTGTYEGSSGSSMNVQVANEYKSRKANSYGSTGLTLTVAKTGTYTISWVAWRSSSSGTMGTNLHIGNTAESTNHETFTGTYGQQITLTNQSLTQGTVLTLYATSGSNSRSIYVANLAIIQTA